MSSPNINIGEPGLFDSVPVGILAQTGTQTGAVVHRTRPALVPVDPTITAAQTHVVVRKSHTNPARVLIRLGVSARFRRSGTLSLITTPTSGDIRFFNAARGGTQLVFTNSQLTFTANELNAGVRMFAEAISPSSNLDEFRLRLTLAPGPTPVGPDAEVALTAVELTLNISPPRRRPAPFAPLPQPPPTPPAPGSTPTDKWFGGAVVSAQDPGNNQLRAQLVVGQVIPTAFAGDLVLQQVNVSGNTIGGRANRVQLFDSETPGPRQSPPVTETPHPGRLVFNASDAGSAVGRQFFVEGLTPSAALRDTGFQLGINGVEDDGDRVALAVAVAPLISVDSPIVVVKRPHTNPRRRVVTLRTSGPFSRSGTLTRSATGTVRIFDQANGGAELNLTGAGRTFTGAQLSGPGGVQVFAESTTASAAADDFQLTLTLAPGTSPVGAPASVSMTAVQLTLDIFAPRTSPTVAPTALTEAEKITPGRFLLAQDAGFTHLRARLVAQRPNPFIPVGTLELTRLRGNVDLFRVEQPGGGQAALLSPHAIVGAAMPAGGDESFVEGKTPPSAGFGDSGFRLGIQGLEPDCDRVVITVLPDPSLPGPFAVGELDYPSANLTPTPATFTTPTITERAGQESSFDLQVPPGDPDTHGPFLVNLKALVRYPAQSAGVNAPVATNLPRYPLVIIAHGNHNTFRSTGARVESFDGLEYLCRHLASYGYIAASIDLEDMNLNLTVSPPVELRRDPTIKQRGLTILEHIRAWVNFNASNPRFSGKVDLTQIGLIGHSRGGEAVVSAQDTNVAEARGHQIRVVVSIAPTDFLGITHTTTPYLVIYGSADNDVSIGWPFYLYDRAAPPKAMIFVYGAIHNRFSTNTDWLATLDSNDVRMISAAEHRDIARGYCLGFFEQFLRGQTDHASLFKRNGRPSRVPAAVQIHHQVQDPARLVVDNFEQGGLNRTTPLPPQLATRATTNTLGGAVTLAGLVVPTDFRNDNTGAPISFANARTEASLRQRDMKFSWHETVGTMLAWDAAGATYRTAFGSRNVSSFQVLSFRVAQRFGSTRNPTPAGTAAGTPQDCFVTLVDSANRTATVQASTITSIPFPFKRIASLVTGDREEFTKTALKTIRIPLSAFTAANGSLTLNAVQAVLFELRPRLTGELVIDDIEFSN